MLRSLRLTTPSATAQGGEVDPGVTALIAIDRTEVAARKREVEPHHRGAVVEDAGGDRAAQRDGDAGVERREVADPATVSYRLIDHRLQLADQGIHGRNVD